MGAAWAIEEIPALRGHAVEWCEPGRLIVSRRNRLFEAAAPDVPLIAAGAVGVPAWLGAATRSRVVQRALRQMFYNVIPLSDGSLFASFARSVGRIVDGRFTPFEGLARPTRVLRGAAAVDREGRVFFGEYLSNPDRGVMRIYSHVPGDATAHVAHEFAAGAIRHVHGVYCDPVDGALWCVTGDIGGEARFLRSEDGFASHTLIGSGDETWRCVSLQFTDDAIYYAMDAEFETNRIFRMDRLSAARDEIGRVDGPVYYSAKRGGDLFFAVTAELCPSQEGRCATLWQVRDDAVSRVASFEKDRHPLQLMPGTLHFALGPGSADELYVSGVALRGADHRVFRLTRC